MSTIIVTDNVSQTLRPYAKKIVELFLKNLSKKVNQLIKKNNAPIVVIPDSVINNISVTNNIEIHCYNQKQIPIVNRINYKPLHEFADALVKISQQSEPNSGLLYKGLPIFRILETLWIDNLLNKFCFYIQLFLDVLQNKKIDQIKITSMRPEMERLITDLAKTNGISSIKEYFCLSSKIISLLRSPLLLSRKTVTDFLLKYLLSQLKKSVKTTAYDQIKKPRVLFIGYKERTLRRLQAALPVLQSQIEFEPCLLADMRSPNPATKTVIEELQQSGLCCSWLSEWLSASEAKEFHKKIKKRLINGWHYIESKSQSDLNYNFQGLTIFPYAERMLKGVCISGGCYVSLLAEIASRVIEKCQPDLVVNFEDWEINNAITLTCKQYGIPSLAYYNLSPESYTGLVRRLPEWMAVSGQILYDDYLINDKRDPERLIIVGDTLCDKIKLLSQKKVRAKVCQTFGLSKQKKIVVVFSAHHNVYWTNTDVENYYKTVFRAIRKLKDVQIIIKVHPQHSVKQTESHLIALECEVDAITKGYNLLELSLAADLVCFGTSSGGTFPMMVGTPAVTIQPRNMVKTLDKLFKFVSGGGAILVTHDQDATDTFRKLLYDPIVRQKQIVSAKKFVTKHCGPLDGSSAQRLANLIVKIIQQTKKSNTNL